MPTFMPGVELSRSLYDEIVRPILGNQAHAAAVLGEGSEVLGLDTERSTDHSWGPRLQVFVPGQAVAEIRTELARRLPDSHMGWPVRLPGPHGGEPVELVEVTTLGEWAARTLGLPWSDPYPTEAWLATSQQVLLEVTAGPVFRDDLGDLTATRAALAWYPHDIWVWMMACQWSLVAAREHLVARTAEVGDALGARMVTGRLARDLVRLSFLQERRYAPYDKWLGTAFSGMRSYPLLAPALESAMRADDAVAREDSMAAVYTYVAAAHNELGVTEPLPATVGPFEVRVSNAVRPYRVLNATRFARACQEVVTGSPLTRLGLVGSIDQLTGATDEIIHFSDWPSRLAGQYRDAMQQPQDA